MGKIDYLRSLNEEVGPLLKTYRRSLSLRRARRLIEGEGGGGTIWRMTNYPLEGIIPTSVCRGQTNPFCICSFNYIVVNKTRSVQHITPRTKRGLSVAIYTVLLLKKTAVRAMFSPSMIMHSKL